MSHTVGPLCWYIVHHSGNFDKWLTTDRPLLVILRLTRFKTQILSNISISNKVIFLKIHSLHSVFIPHYNNTNIMKISSQTTKFCAFPMGNNFEFHESWFFKHYCIYIPFSVIIKFLHKTKNVSLRRYAFMFLMK